MYRRRDSAKNKSIDRSTDRTSPIGSVQAPTFRTGGMGNSSMARSQEEFTCPVCGYAHLHRPAWNESPSFEICPCCGVQFGYDDSMIPHAVLRQFWLSRGASWCSNFTKPPVDWSPFTQLQAAALHADPVDECPFCGTSVVAGGPVEHWNRKLGVGILFDANCDGCGAELRGVWQGEGEILNGIAWGSVD